MRISVVTVTFNSAATLRDTLDSVTAQTYGNVEQVIIDGGSGDATLECVRRHGKRVAYCVSERDRGIYDAMNKGWRAASGDIIGFLNSDDVYSDPDALQWIAEAFRDDAIEACYGDLVYVRRDDLSRVVRYWQSRPFEAGLFARGWQPPHPTLYLRRSVFERCGGFDLRYRIQSDFDFCLRTFEKVKVASRYVPKVLVKMRVGGESNRSLRNVVRGNLEAYRSCRSNGLQVPPTFIVRKVLSRIPQYFQRHP